MTFLNIVLLQVLLLAIGQAQQTAQYSVSNCLGNCQTCDPKNPTVCLEGIDNSTGKITRCVPFYEGPECLLGGSYYNFYTENGILNNFVNWSVPSQPQRQQCDSMSGGNSLTGMGPFSSSLNATKVLQFSAGQTVSRLLIKIGVGVSDSRLLSSGSNSSQTVEYVEINGSLYIVTTDTSLNQSQSIQQIPFLKMEVKDLLSNNAIIATGSSVIRNPSSLQTKCGFVYQFQFVAQALTGSYFQQLLLNLYLPQGSSTLWWLFDFRAEAGCSGFSVGSTCSSCLTGFYPALTGEGYANGCKHCSLACGTCGSGGSCLSCEQYASFESSTQSCSYPVNYAIYNRSDNFSLIAGSKLSVTSLFFIHIYKSQDRQLSWKFTLRNAQSYLIKMYLLFPQTYISNGATFVISIDGQQWITTDLNGDRPTLSNINNGNQRLFVLPFKIDRMGASITNPSQIIITAQGQSLGEFYVGDLAIVQYQCSLNCLECSFSVSQTATCQKCLPFYNREMNCLTCANGFFEVQADSNRCVKCFSDCEQCKGPSFYECTSCFKSFGLQDVTYNFNCIGQMKNVFNQVKTSSQCSSTPNKNQIRANSKCFSCLSKSEFVISTQDCHQCWLDFGYMWGRCRPLSTSSLTFYASGAQPTSGTAGWKSPGLTTYQCTSDYQNLVGVPNILNNLNNSVPSPTTMSTTFENLPPHYGLRFTINIFKVDYWAEPTASTANKVYPLSFSIAVSSPNQVTSSLTVPLSNSVGANICGESANEMIWTLTAEVADHSASTVTISVSAPDKGIFVKDINLYLGNCQECSNIALSYALFYLPAYADNNTQTGLDVFATFNHPVLFKATTNPGNEVFLNSFSFSVDGQPTPFTIKESFLTNPDLRYIKFFLPLQKSFINATVTASTNKPDLVYTDSNGMAQQLVTSSQSVAVQRYADASDDTRRSMSQMSDFFNFFTWFALIVMIVSVGLGVGVVFQEFSQIMQIIFYHIYITTWLLPPTIKVPLSHASRMEHLNYFSNINSIEDKLFGLQPIIPSNYIFQQFNIDVYFLRSIYPILIINAIFIGWFIILKIIEAAVAPFRNSPNKVVRFLRSIPSRPLAYFDQIWRYQFLAVMWACMLQFTSFKGEGGQKLNLVICILAFIISLAWPFVVIIYTYKRHFTTNVKHFLYLYHDLYYLKTSSLCDEPKSYMYTALKSSRLLAYAIFIALFVNESVIGPVLLIFFNLIDGLAAFFLDIYRTAPYLLTRIIENILLIVSAILCLVIYGFSNRTSLNTTEYQNLGYGLSTVFVLMIINAVARFLYLCYKKIKEWSVGSYDVGERGEVQNFDYRSPVKVPQSQRLQTN